MGKAKQPQFPQPLLTRLVLQTLHQLPCPSLDTLQHLNVSLVVRGPKLNTVFEAAFQPLFPKPVALHGVVVTQVQDPALGLVEPHTIDLGPLIQPVQVPLQSLPTLKQINTPTQLGVICKLTEGALNPFVQIIDKDIKQDWPQHRALGNTTCDWLPTGVNSIHHSSLGPAIQPVLYPVKSTPVQAMSSQLPQENAVSSVFIKVQDCQACWLKQSTTTGETFPPWALGPPWIRQSRQQKEQQKELSLPVHTTRLSWQGVSAGKLVAAMLRDLKQQYPPRVLSTEVWPMGYHSSDKDTVTFTTSDEPEKFGCERKATRIVSFKYSYSFCRLANLKLTLPKTAECVIKRVSKETKDSLKYRSASFHEQQTKGGSKLLKAYLRASESVQSWIRKKKNVPFVLNTTGRLNNPSSLSRSSQDLCSRPCTSFLALLWTPSSISMSQFKGRDEESQVREQSILHTRRFGSKSYDGHKSQLITHLTTVAIYVQISSADLATIKRLMHNSGLRTDITFPSPMSAQLVQRDSPPGSGRTALPQP
ncbi:hypothetical protein QYF61_011723 [Mycteria americana]|uniref:Uncharacterized protein n=1 Tax=Mycteria americana TaxID=33587 RepID=A0AAN7P6S0_MYCAM|nr:hypothetical protein QYF61_011723 [Mycteria americana]